VFLSPKGGLVRAMLLATEDARRGVWLTLVSDLAQAYFQLLALEVVG
jgi:outer membrane protein TolC